METPISKGGTACPPATLKPVDRAAQVPALQLSKTEFLQTFSPVKCLKQFKTDTTPLSCAQHNDIPTATDLRLQYGDDYLTGYIKLWIINCFEYFGAKPPDGDRLEEAVTFCLEKRYYLNLSDITLIFSNLKRNYMDITLQRIVKAFADYADERAVSYYEKKLKENDVIQKHGYMPSPVNDIAKQTAESMIEHQLEQAKKDADSELLKLNQDYQLHEVLKKIKRNKQLTMDN